MAGRRPERFRSHTRRSHALGAETAITVWHGDSVVAEAGLEEAFAAIDAVEDLMSLYRPPSQLCRLNRQGELADPHPDLVKVLRHAQALSGQTDGAFDITVQPLWAARQGGVSVSEVESEKIDWRRLDVWKDRVCFRDAGMAATLNGIAQGFAADRVAETLGRHGICHALIDTGEVASLGQREGQEPWRVGLQHPRQPEAFLGVAGLRDRCLATSGDYATTLDRDFEEHHLIDPKTGRSPQQLSSVSVATTTAMEADALSTAAFVLGLECGLALIEQTPGADALMVRKEDGAVFASKGFPRLQTEK